MGVGQIAFCVGAQGRLADDLGETVALGQAGLGALEAGDTATPVP